MKHFCVGESERGAVVERGIKERRSAGNRQAVGQDNLPSLNSIAVGGQFFRGQAFQKELVLEDALDNDSGIFDEDGNLLEGVEIVFDFDSLPDYIQSPEWDEDSLSFILRWEDADHEEAAEDADAGDEGVDPCDEDAELEEGAGAMFNYQATFGGEVLDTATVSLFTVL